MDSSVLVLLGITFFAAFVNGALGYGFSSLTVPVALLFHSSRILNPALVLIVPLGAYAIRRLDAETFRRVCMSFDVWVVGFGLSRVLLELKLANGAFAYGPMLLAGLLDAWLLYLFFSKNVQIRQHRPAVG